MNKSEGAKKIGPPQKKNLDPLLGTIYPQPLGLIILTNRLTLYPQSRDILCSCYQTLKITKTKWVKRYKAKHSYALHDLFLQLGHS